VVNLDQLGYEAAAMKAPERFVTNPWSKLSASQADVEIYLLNNKLRQQAVSKTSA
jgi:hypothetical protein